MPTANHPARSGQPYLVLVTAVMLALAMASAALAEATTLRIGHFPNVTHAHGLVAHNFTRQGKGWFEQRLGPDVKMEWFIYNAGPSAMEAIFANSIDLTYVGPNPALNAYAKSRGEEIRIVAGCTKSSTGGALSILVRGDIRASRRGAQGPARRAGNRPSARWRRTCRALRA